MYTGSTRLCDMTVDDLREFLREEKSTAEREPDGIKADRVLKGLKAIAGFLGISERTLGEWKRHGIIGEPTINQTRRIVTANESDLLAFRPKKKQLNRYKR